MLTVIARAEGDLMRCVSVILSKAWPGAPRLWSSIAAQAEQSVMPMVLSRAHAHCGVLTQRWGAGWVNGGRLSNYLLTRV